MYFVKSFNVENNEEVDDAFYFSTMDETDHYVREMIGCTLSRFQPGLKVFLDYVYVHHTPMFSEGKKGYHIYYKVGESEWKIEFTNQKAVIKRPDS
ncbi:hypothetical protein [Bacillus sp. AK031]